MLRPRAVGAVWLTLAVVAARPVHAIDRTPADLVLAQPGTLPIILTAPHGGREAIPSAAPRRAENETSRKWGGFKTGGDANTDVLAERMAAEITQRTAKATRSVCSSTCTGRARSGTSSCVARSTAARSNGCCDEPAWTE